MTTYHRAARVDHPILTRCQHAQGDTSLETCLYLHTLERIRDWTLHAERAYRDGEGRRAQISELWVLSAELAYAHDNCPDGARLSETILPKGSLHLRDTLGLPVTRS